MDIYAHGKLKTENCHAELDEGLLHSRLVKKMPALRMLQSFVK